MSIYDLDSIESIRQQLRIDPGYLRRLRTTFFKHSRGQDASIAALPPEAQEQFSQQVGFHPLQLDKRFDSSQDGASKLVFRTASGYAIESIILRAETGRVSLCVSSQVGCAAKCDFCATGRMGMAHNLTPEEILDQLVQANEAIRSEGRRVRNLVFMGMGEPFHNEAALRTALKHLTSAKYFNHSPSRILVSTVGIPEPLVDVATDFPDVNFAISLHSVDPSVRQSLIPLASRHSLDDLQDAIRRLNSLQPTKARVMIEHLMLDRLNDSPNDAQRLIDWLDGLRVHVNLIPFNAVEEASHLKSSPRKRIEEFSSTIRNAGIPTTIRYSMGSDIDAACGQLVQQENRKVAIQHAINRR